MLEIGITNTKELIVTKENTALALGSGTLEVFATPAMIALMEGTAAESVEAFLEEGQTTVGTALDVKHLAASPIDMPIHCESELIAVDGRALTFNVATYDKAGKIGEGTHSRFIVDAKKFFTKAQGKLD